MITLVTLNFIAGRGIIIAPRRLIIAMLLRSGRAPLRGGPMSRQALLSISLAMQELTTVMVCGVVSFQVGDVMDELKVGLAEAIKGWSHSAAY